MSDISASLTGLEDLRIDCSNALLLHGPPLPGFQVVTVSFTHQLKSLSLSSNQALTTLYSTMLWSNRYFNCLNSLCALLLSSQPIVGTGFVPRDVAAGETIERRLCDPAAPDVSESSVRLLQLAVVQFLLT